MSEKIVENKTFDGERALYGERDLVVRNCRFDGPADGESAFKECDNVTVEGAFMNLRYPFWHDRGLTLRGVEMTELCRAALWYSSDVTVEGCRLHGIKALRECARVRMRGCDIVSPEFGWSTRGIEMVDCTAQSEYFMMRSCGLRFRNVRFAGKYSFQYIEDAVFENCDLDTKDAFWHAKNVVVRNSRVRGEYLGWYNQNVTFENCEIVGTQPLCYCESLRLVNCRMDDCDLAFERSHVQATLTAPIVSVKNPLAGSHIVLPAVGEVIRDIDGATGVVEGRVCSLSTSQRQP
ncbi:MAG TPA: DUF3737 family protein [Candidatus Olsenella pullicola]|nr:DUF3737 family protein [Candidatus Olsenella pullicola]